MLNLNGFAILGKRHLQNGKDFGRCVCIIKKPGGLPRWAVLPAFSLPVFNFFHKPIKQKTAGWRFARGFVTPALRPAFCGFAAMLRRKAFQMPQAVFERGSNTSCNSKNKRPPDGRCDRGIVNPRFAHDFLRICCYAASAKLFKCRKRHLRGFDQRHTRDITQKASPCGDAFCVMVEHRGIEPLTSRLRTLRSPS